MIPLFANAQTIIDDDEVVIEGRRKSKAQVGTFGVVRNSSSGRLSEQDVAHQLKSDSSVSDIADTQRSPRGFRLPSIRGHDARNTDVYVGSFRVFDPYSGMGNYSDFDLRAFEGFRVYKGTPPAELSGSTGLAALQFLPAEHNASDLTVGSKGSSQSDLRGDVKWDHAWSPSFETRIFARTAFGPGDFTYYSDNGTPYEEQDDFLTERSDGFYRQNSVMPHFQMYTEDIKLKILGLASDSKYGVPLRSSLDASDAVARTQRNFLGMSTEGKFGTALKWKVLASQLRTNNALLDPKGYVLIVPSKASLSTQTSQISLDLKTTFPFVNPYLYLGVSNARVDFARRATTRGFSRDSREMSGGVDVQAHEWFRTDLRIGQTHFSDNQSNAPAMNRNKLFRSVSTRAGSENAALYVQFAVFDRPPTLLETFGDGIGIEDNFDLNNDKTTHREIGLLIGEESSIFQSEISLFRDSIRDKVAFIPVSGTSERAVNLNDSEITGLEMSFYFEKNPYDAVASYVSMIPLRTYSDQTRTIPRTPTRTTALGFGYSIQQVRFGWNARHQSRIFLDEDNALEIPELVVHDISVDGQFRPRFSRLKAGINVTNVFDVKSSTTSARDGRIGKSAIKDANGLPMSGRCYELALDFIF